MPTSPRRLALATFAISLLLIGILIATVVPISANLREKARQAMIERDAAVLHPVALQQLAELEASSTPGPTRPRELMSAALKSARQPGMLAVVIFDATGTMLQTVPPTLLLPELAAGDYLTLLGGSRISRFYAEFPLDRHFRDVAPTQRSAPVLEILLPLHDADDTETLGFAHYLIDARMLARELATLDAQIRRQTLVTLTLGATLIALLSTGTYLGLRRAHGQIAERSERLARANFELTLAAKASALGQITSHLIHGLQGPVAGLRAVVAGRSHAENETDWQSASDYTERLECLVRETVALLSDVRAEATYELTGNELITSLRQSTTLGSLPSGAVTYSVAEGVLIDNHRGSVLCLIAANLIQNAADATSGSGTISVVLSSDEHVLKITVTDDGPGVPAVLRHRLFEPGCSGRSGGSGLGLAISRLLARQIDATLALDHTGPAGSSFSLTLPHPAAALR
jgi:signal transduction histidine kinase